jgi:hypothetical protein
MNSVREFTRYVPRCSRFQEPTGQEVTVRLVESGGRYFIRTPWACVDATSGRDTTDAQLGALISPCFETEAEAVAWAKLHAPHWFDKRNDAVRSKLFDAIRWHGDFTGPARLGDALGVSETRLRAVVNGTLRATAREARLARQWGGGPA